MHVTPTPSLISNSMTISYEICIFLTRRTCEDGSCVWIVSLHHEQTATACAMGPGAIAGEAPPP
eukprot:2636568-Amphidinium_carterae.1